MVMIDFARIGNRLLLTVGVVVGLGLAGVILLYAQRQEASILAENEKALTQVTDSTVQGLQAIMVRGYAEIAHGLMARLKRIDGVIDYRLLRMDGRQAFIDNSTIDAVNQRLGDVRFEPRRETVAAPQVLAADDPNIRRMQARGDHVFYYETLPSGERTVTLLEPMLNGSGCEKCHSEAAPMRGMLLLKTSLAPVEADIRRTWMTSVAVIVVGLFVIFAIVWRVAQRAVVEPIQRVTDAMVAAARGDLSVRVPVTGRDEIGNMARSFNEMSRQLLDLYAGLADEQNKLTTIILGAHEGIVVTDALGKVVLINPATRSLLGKSEEQIVENGFLQLVDDPQWMAARLAADAADSRPGLLDYRGRTLMIEASTIRGLAGAVTGSAAIIRDVTEEKRLEAELQKMAITDALTGLFNRRHFDACIADELARWQRYRGAFAVMLLDVDHFKNFNDTHGHDCGDRVLQAIGAVLRNVDEPTAIACRYGGEELVVIVPEIGQEACGQMAERVRLAIAALVIDGLQVTVSVGVAGCPPHAPVSGEALVKLADEALYRAKAGGRNRVVLA